MRITPILLPLLLAGGLAVSASVATAADKSVTVTGTVARVQASDRTVAVTLPDGTQGRFLWNSETKINGVLAPGAKVTIRYSTDPEGRNLALQITVARG